MKWFANADKPQPRLNPPHKGWLRDLPEPDAPLEKIKRLNTKPNAVNDTYLEISRAGMRYQIPGIVLVTGFAFMGLFLVICFSAGYFLSSETASLEIELKLIFISAIIFLLVSTIGAFWSTYLMTFLIPRDEPLRFNRKTGKVYACGCHIRWWPLPFKVTKRYEVYDWQDLRAEEYRQRKVAAGGGGFAAYSVEFVAISEVKRGTNTVVDQLLPDFRDRHGIQAWEYIRRYMQGGVNALPQTELRRYPNSSRNIRMMMQLPVEWPARMDIESRSAPDGSIAPPPEPLNPKHIARLKIVARWLKVVYFGALTALCFYLLYLALQLFSK